MAKKSARKPCPNAASQGRGKGSPSARPQGQAGAERPKADAEAAHGDVPPMTDAEIEEAFRRFQPANPEPKGELQIRQSVHAAGRGGAVGAGDRCRRQQGDAGAVCARRHAGENGGARRGPRARPDQDHRALRTKAKNVVTCRAELVAEHGGEVPRTREALEALPGVGRKTANVVLNIAFGEPTIAVDTHIFRVGNRTGLATGKTPLEVETEAAKVVPAKYMRTRIIG